jgi:hypothetical protein
MKKIQTEQYSSLPWSSKEFVVCNSSIPLVAKRRTSKRKYISGQ